jgi:hypothetical protein
MPSVASVPEATPLHQALSRMSEKARRQRMVLPPDIAAQLAKLGETSHHLAPLVSKMAAKIDPYLGTALERPLRKVRAGG